MTPYSIALILSCLSLCLPQLVWAAELVMKLPIGEPALFKILPEGSYAGDPRRLKEIPATKLPEQLDPYLILHETLDSFDVKLGARSFIRQVGFKPGGGLLVISNCANPQREATPGNQPPRINTISLSVPSKWDGRMVLVEFTGSNRAATKASVWATASVVRVPPLMPTAPILDQLAIVILSRSDATQELTELKREWMNDVGTLSVGAEVAAGAEVVVRLMVAAYKTVGYDQLPDEFKKMLHPLALARFRVEGLTCDADFPFADTRR